MTLDEAFQITFKMSWEEDRNPTEIQRKAKELIYNNTIKPEYEGKGLDVPEEYKPHFLVGRAANDSD